MSGHQAPTTTALEGAARRAIGSACERVHEPDESEDVDGVGIGLVAHPATTEETSQLMKAAAAHGLAVVAQGRGTKMTWGRPPARADVLVDLSAMGQVLDHAAGDLVLVTQAGARLTDVQETVAGARQRLALDETVPGASIGGVIATATSGPGRMATGTVRDLLIGITVVRADGVVAKAGGRVVKNVAGYDLGKLLIGSFGTLAVITEAVFRLHPSPAARSFVSVPVQSPKHAHELAQAILHSQVVPGGLELDWPADGSGTLTVLLAGIAEGVEGRTATALGILGTAACRTSVPPDAWGAYPWPLGAVGDRRATALKMTFALSGLSDVLAVAREARVEVRGSAGVGVLYGAIPPQTDVPAIRQAVAALRTVSARHGGSVVVLDAAADVKQAVDTWGPVSGLDLMRRVKDRFDPEGRLAPGRFVGGI